MTTEIRSDPPDETGDFPAPLSRGKKILFSIILAVVLLGVAEVALRIAFPRLAWSSARYLWDGGETLEPDRAEWPATYPKSAKGRHAYIEFDVPVSYNSDGFRGDDFDPSKGPVVIFGGDSTTAGHGIHYDDMFTTRIEAALRERFGNMQLWNLGRSGSGPVVQALLLERILDKYPSAEIAAVVLISSVSTQRGAGNDLLDMQRNLPYLDGGRPESGSRKLSLRYMLRKSAVIHGAEALVAKWRRENIRMPRLENWDTLWDNMYRCLDHMRQSAEKRNAPFVVAFLAARPSERSEDVEEVAQRYKRYLDEHQLTLIRCEPILAKALRDKLYYYPIDGHINAIAHRYVADTIIPPLITLLESTNFHPPIPATGPFQGPVADTPARCGDGRCCTPAASTR